MLDAGIKPQSLEELESHLREEFEHQMDPELNEQDVFNAAAGKIGQAHALRIEFSKNNRLELIELMKNPKMASRLSLAVVLLATVWLAFSAVMIGKDLFINDGLIGLRASEGAQVKVENGSPILLGTGIVSAGEKYQLVLIPALAIPFAVLVGFAIIGCRSVFRSRLDEHPITELLTSGS